MFARRYLAYGCVAATLVTTAAWLLWIGREPICTCGHVKFWHGEVLSPENSQHISDWYTPSHIIHGLLFYAALWPAARRLSFGWRLALATLVEAGWEILENTDAIIDRYRAVTISLDYYGDSVLNSVADILAMILGFFVARWVPVWVSVALVVGFEVLTAVVIRDGLVLNVLMLLWPIEAVKQWQSGL